MRQPLVLEACLEACLKRMSYCNLDRGCNTRNANSTFATYQIRECQFFPRTFESAPRVYKNSLIPSALRE
eukprot:469160-Pelagomonas_calceolata.AAC.1